MRHSAAHLVRRHAGIGPAEHVTARHVEGAVLANLRGDPVVPTTVEEAAARFTCGPLRVAMTGEACAKRRLVAPTREGKGLGRAVVHCGPCEHCAAGAARVRLLGLGGKAR